MRTISIRQFQQHFHKELASLPFTVTKRGVPYFNVVTYNGTDHNVTTVISSSSKTIEALVEKMNPILQEKRPDIKLCKHGSAKGLCKFGCK